MFSLNVSLLWGFIAENWDFNFLIGSVRCRFISLELHSIHGNKEMCYKFIIIKIIWLQDGSNKLCSSSKWMNLYLSFYLRHSSKDQTRRIWVSTRWWKNSNHPSKKKKHTLSIWVPICVQLSVLSCERQLIFMMWLETKFFLGFLIDLRLGRKMSCSKRLEWSKPCKKI